MILNYYYIIILILALVFFLISYRDIRTLVSIIIIIIIGYYLYSYYEKISQDDYNNIKNKNDLLTKKISGRKELLSDNYIIEKFPNTIKYLIKDEKLVEIIFNIEFIKVFDNGKYLDIINYMDKFMKIYIYILTDRYNSKDYFSSLIDIRQSILEMLYSCFIIIPEKVKYIYGLNTYKELYDNINLFAKYSSKMINIVKKYSILEKKIIFLEDTKIRAYNKTNENNLP